MLAESVLTGRGRIAERIARPNSGGGSDEVLWEPPDGLRDGERAVRCDIDLSQNTTNYPFCCIRRISDPANKRLNEQTRKRHFNIMLHFRGTQCNHLELSANKTECRWNTSNRQRSSRCSERPKP